MMQDDDRNTDETREKLLNMAAILAVRARNQGLNYASFYFETQQEHLIMAHSLSETDANLSRSSFVYAMQ